LPLRYITLSSIYTAEHRIIMAVDSGLAGRICGREQRNVKRRPDETFSKVDVAYDGTHRGDYYNGAPSVGASPTGGASSTADTNAATDDAAPTTAGPATTEQQGYSQ
jgi:hypothetical protein